MKRKSNKKMEEFNAIDLFAGCGGLSLGLERAGFNVLWANEINQDAADTYIHNLGKKTQMVVKNICDISVTDIKKAVGNKRIHLVAGGPPCQGFSMAGKRDINDPRNSLFRQLLRIVEGLEPDFFIMENVKGILTMDGGRVISKIKDSFEKLDGGYEVQIKVLNASNFGVPQTRERVFIIGSKIKGQKLHPEPYGTKVVSVKEAIDDLSFLLSGQESTEYKLPALTEFQKLMRKEAAAVLNNHEAPKHSEKVVERFSHLKPGQTSHDLPAHQKTKKMVLFRFDDKKPARTVTTLPDDYIHYKHDRIPSVREMARLQSFPDDFVFLGSRTTGGDRRKHSVPQYSQVGNAVPPLLAEAVGRHLLKLLKKAN